MGLQDLAKKFGEVKINGVLWCYDHVQNKSRIRSEMTDDEWKASEKIKWEKIKEQFDGKR